MRKAETVITYGTFDMLHIGHLNLLRRCSQLGQRLVVGVSTDEFNLQKGKRSIIPFEQRSKLVEAIRHVDEVFPEESWDQKIKDIRRFKASIFVMGDDWRGKFDFLSTECNVMYLPRTSGRSSTSLKEAIAILSMISGS